MLGGIHTTRLNIVWRRRVNETGASMAAIRKVVELPLTDKDLTKLQSIARSRTESASRVERARCCCTITASCYGVARDVGVTHQTVQSCQLRATTFGVMAALDDRPRPGKEREITAEARVWLASTACQRPQELGYPHELWIIGPACPRARAKCGPHVLVADRAGDGPQDAGPRGREAT